MLTLPALPLTIQHILLYTKVTTLEEIRRGVRHTLDYRFLREDRKVIAADAEHQHSVAVVRDELARCGLQVRAVEVIEPSDVEWADCVICVGGDGTFLKATRHIQEHHDVPVLGVNSAPSSSFGFFCAADYHSFPTLLASLLSHHIMMRNLWRLRCCLNGTPISHLVLNEVLFCNPVPSATTRYLLECDGVQQLQQSSGVWVSTASGSTGAILGAGGMVMSLDDWRMQYQVRELFSLPILHPRKLNMHLTYPHMHSQPQHNHRHSSSTTTASPPHPDTTPVSCASPTHSDALSEQAAAGNTSPSPSTPAALATPSFSSSSSSSSSLSPSCTSTDAASANLLTHGYLSSDFTITSRMLSSCIYLDGSTTPIPVRFNDRISFRRSERPLRWVCPTRQDEMGREEAVDHWELLVQCKRPTAPPVNHSLTQPTT